MIDSDKSILKDNIVEICSQVHREIVTSFSSAKLSRSRNSILLSRCLHGDVSREKVFCNVAIVESAVTFQLIKNSHSEYYMQKTDKR